MISSTELCLITKKLKNTLSRFGEKAKRLFIGKENSFQNQVSSVFIILFSDIVQRTTKIFSAVLELWRDKQKDKPYFKVPPLHLAFS